MSKSKFIVIPKENAEAHPRNRMLSGYDFGVLISKYPDLKPFVFTNKFGTETVDFADAKAVRALNAALLLQNYGIEKWDILEGYLVPPVPGRADHIHHLADLMAAVNKDVVPIGRTVRVLDLGVGSSCIYPILGNKEYGWSFVGSEIDITALESAQHILDHNKGLKEFIQLRLQPSSGDIMKGIIREDDDFDLVMCNPPFHSSFEEMQEAVERKWNNLRIKPLEKPHLNFGGQSTELISRGGELAFVLRMIEESIVLQKNCYWFSSLISKEANLQPLYNALSKAEATEIRTIQMVHGQKRSRIVAWTFLTEYGQRAWRERHWWTTLL